MSEIKVNSIKGVAASTAAITVNNTDGTCTANITNNLSNRNLIINGAMQVAQRGTSSTTNDGYFTVDRMYFYNGAVDENCTTSQSSVSSGTTPYTLGFRKAFRVQNGNQTSGAGAGDEVLVRYKFEAQDIDSSGWNYKSSSSFITLSYWVKSSVAQNFYVNLKTSDGTAYNYVTETGSLTADTWTKVTKTIPGDSNLTFDDNNGEGLFLQFNIFKGTNDTGTRPLNAWAAYSSSSRVPDMTSTWYTTNDATFEITGLQLEVGSVATDFEHRSFAQELALCQRYYEIGVHGNYGHVAGGGTHKFYSQFKTQKRSSPTLAIISSGENYVSSVGIAADPSDATLGCRIQGAVVSGATGDNKYIDAKFSSDAEL